MTEHLTPRGIVFWPVGTGDSTTIVVDEEIVVQVDINDQAQADQDDSKVVAVVDQLAESLPPTGPGGMPYLAVFVLTHADVDHCRGFEDLLSTVAIGELWVTPRLWREYLDDGIELSAPAEAFRQEAERRITATMGAGEDGPESGDRILVIGYDTDHDKHAYSELSDQYLAWPGSSITTLDGVDCTGKFEAFLHAPFKDDCAKARNDTSVAMQVTLTDGTGTGQFLLFGDLAAATVGKIIEVSAANGNDDRLAWDVLLAPHHCSKHAVYENDEVRQDILDALEANARPGARVVSSSHPSGTPTRRATTRRTSRPATGTRRSWTTWCCARWSTAQPMPPAPSSSRSTATDCTCWSRHWSRRRPAASRRGSPDSRDVWASSRPRPRSTRSGCPRWHRAGGALPSPAHRAPTGSARRWSPTAGTTPPRRPPSASGSGDRR